MPKVKHKIGIYIRTKEGVYSLVGDIEKVRAMNRMTPEQIEFCEKMKIEMENRKYAPVR